MMYPVKEYKNISTEFGEPVLGSYFGRHLGLDFPVPIGTEVFAPVGGKVRAVQNASDVGLLIELEGDDGYYHRFLHLSRQDVYLGQRVEKGQRIALSGNSGSASTGPHLHWDIRKPSDWNESFDNYIDPSKYVEGDDMPDEGWLYALHRIAFGEKATPEWVKNYLDSGKNMFKITDEVANYALNNGIANEDFQREVLDLAATMSDDAKLGRMVRELIVKGK